MTRTQTFLVLLLFPLTVMILIVTFPALAAWIVWSEMRSQRRERISAKRLAEIAAIPDSEIDTLDIPEVGAEFFETARLERRGGS